VTAQSLITGRFMRVIHTYPEFKPPLDAGLIDSIPHFYLFTPLHMGIKDPATNLRYLQWKKAIKCLIF